MNRKTFCILGLLLGSFAAPSFLPAQNLILDSGFESGSLVNGPSYCGTPVRKKSVYGLWAGVSGAYGYGWAVTGLGTNKVLATCGGKSMERGASLPIGGKRVFQEVSEKAVLPGTYTLKFRYQCSPSLLTLGSMAITVAQRTEDPSEFRFHVETHNDVELKGYKILVEKPLLTGQQSEIPAPGQWRTVETNFDVSVGGKSLVVMFTGMAETNAFCIDDVSLTRKGGSPVAPEKTLVAQQFMINPLQKSVAAPAAISVAKPAVMPAAVISQPAPAVKPVPVAAVSQPAPVVKPVVAPVSVQAAKPPAVVAPTPAPEPVTASVSAPAVMRPVPEPVRPPIDNLVLGGDFSSASLALPTATGDTTAELSGRWLRSTVSSWEISPYGGNLGPYARAAASRDTARLLYVVSDAKRSTGSYLLRFDYVLTDPSDVLGVKVFVSDRDITIGTDGGVLKMNDTRNLPDMIMLPSSPAWGAYYVPVELGSGYNYIYVLFAGSGAGNTGIDNVSLSPKRR